MYKLCSSGFDGFDTDSDASGCLLLTTEDEELVEEGFPILVMYHAKTNDRVVYQGDIKWTGETVTHS